jgi:hypothetical protein
VSVSIESPSKDTVMMKIVDAESKPCDYIADEIRARGKAMSDGATSLDAKKAKIMNVLPLFLRIELEKFFHLVGSGLG